MAPFYQNLCEETGTPIDEKLLKEMQTVNEQRLKVMDEEIKDAEENLGTVCGI